MEQKKGNFKPGQGNFRPGQKGNFRPGQKGKFGGNRGPRRNF